jgi:steroid 5-alpha reductase family enzyme
LGDTLVHLSFLLINITDSFNPIVLLGPLANYLFLRLVGGDKKTEESQEKRYREQDSHKYEQLCNWRGVKNSVWPSLKDLTNPWALVVVGCGLIGVVTEEVVRSNFTMR